MMKSKQGKHTSISYFQGARDAKQLDLTIGQQLDITTKKYGDRLAVVVKHQSIHWNFRQYHQQISEFAAGLLSLGITPGDRVGIWAPNCIEWCIGQFATAKVGEIMVCLNPAYRLHELAYALDKVGCKALITATQFKGSNYLSMLQTLIPELEYSAPGQLKSADFPQLTSIIRMGQQTSDGMYNFADVSAMATLKLLSKVSRVGEQLSPDDPINIQFTSGTTGNPKGATLSHRGILNNGFQVGQQMQLGVNDKLCIPVPLYHCFGMVMGNLACLTHGSAAIFPSQAFDPISCLEAIAQYRCTAVHGVPTMFIAQLSEPTFSQYDLSSLRTGIMAGSLCPIEVIKKVMKNMHMAKVLIAYGQTETSPVNHMTDVDECVELRVSTVGRVGPHLDVKLVDGNGDIVPIGEPGEICIRGYAVMQGYWQDAKQTASTIKADGWLHSGDIGQLDVQGYLTITGRIKDMIIRGGENIYPREIEEFLYSHPDIVEVQVFGVSCKKYGEKVCAWIKCQPNATLTAELVQQYCKENISYFKIPQHIEFVDEFPMTVTGKMQKFVMRDSVEQQLGS